MEISLIRGSAVTSLTDGVLARLLGVDGTGEAPVHRIEERGPQQHGSTDVDYRLDPREVQLALWVNGSSLADLETKRKALVDALRPTTGAKALRFTLDNGEVYQIDGHSAGSMTMPLAGGDGFALRTGVTFRAADPTFYDPTGDTVSLAVGGGADAFVVPMPVPHYVGASTLDANTAIAYAGTWRAYPVIRITGPISGPVITNVSTGEDLAFTGVTIVAGNWYTIDLRYGYKTVTNSSGANKIAELSNASDLATWHLADDSEVTGGVNSITVTGTAGAAATRVDIIYNARYVGI